MTAIPAVNVDLFTATGAGQRYAAYAALAAAAPVHRTTLPSGEPAWLITGHLQVRQALHDPRIIKREATGAILTRDLLPADVVAATSSHMLGRIALGGLLARFPRLRLAVPPGHLTWRPGVIMHRLDALPVLLD